MTIIETAPSIELVRPPWAQYAFDNIGIHEVAGLKDNPWIVDALALAGLPGRHDETPWCGACATKCMVKTGFGHPKHPAAARSWFGYGVRLAHPILGCILVFERVDPREPTVKHGHVGFYERTLFDAVGDAMAYDTLGGNEDNSLKIKPYAAHRLLGCFYPPDAPLPPHAVLYAA
jgi:uncharacterized protein (TIGR02594 family)